MSSIDLYIEEWTPPVPERESVDYKHLRTFYDTESKIPIYEMEINRELEVGKLYEFGYVDWDGTTTNFELVLKKTGNVYLTCEYYNRLYRLESKYLGDGYIPCNAKEDLGLDLVQIEKEAQEKYVNVIEEW